MKLTGKTLFRLHLKKQIYLGYIYFTNVDVKTNKPSKALLTTCNFT